MIQTQGQTPLILVTQVDTKGPPLEHAQAERIAKKLGLVAEENFSVQLKPAQDTKLNRIAHDRYIRTSQDIALGFSRGFDLLGNDGKCLPCDVYLHQISKSSVIDQILNSRNAGVWRNSP